MDYESLKSAHYVYFFMYTAKKIDEYYRARWAGLLSAVAFFVNLFRSLAYSPWSIKALARRSGRVAFFFVSQNNLDALQAVYDEMKPDAVLVTTEGRFRREAILLPMFAAYIFSLFQFPKLLRFYFGAPPNERRIIGAFLQKIWLSLGYHTLCRMYLRLAAPKAIVFTNDHVYENRVLVRLAEARGIKCFYLQHSSAFDDVPRVFSSYALLEGEHARGKYLSVGSDDERIRLIGIPKLDQHIKNANHADTVQRVGICTNRSMPVRDVEDMISQMSAEFPTLQLTLRPHPGTESNTKYRDLIERYGLRLCDSRRVDVLELEFPWFGRHPESRILDLPRGCHESSDLHARVQG